MEKQKHSSVKVYGWYIQCLERDGYKCRKCGATKNIIVHHKDNSRKLGFYKMNNDLENLLTLCISCHKKEHGSCNSDWKKETIIELVEAGLSYAEVGRKYNLSRQRIERIYKKSGGSSSCDFIKTA